MKLIKCYGKLEFLVEDDEAENIVKFFGKQTLVKLRNGDYLNPATITAIIDPPKAKYWGGYRVADDNSVYREGVKIYLEPKNIEEIEYRDDPEYQNLKRLT